MPRQVDHAARRAELADAATELIADVGVDGLRLRDVAARAGCTTGMLTHYFADKRELLRFTFGHLARRTGQRARRPSPVARTAWSP